MKELVYPGLGMTADGKCDCKKGMYSYCTVAVGGVIANIGVHGSKVILV